MFVEEPQIFDYEDKILFSNDKVSIEFFKETGYYNVDYEYKGQRTSLKNCYIAINYFENGKLVEFSSVGLKFRSIHKTFCDTVGDCVRVVIILREKSALFDFKLELDIYEDAEFCLIKVADIKTRSEKPIKIHSISPLTIKNENIFLTGMPNPTNFKNITFFKNGYQSWSANKILFSSDKDIKGPPLLKFPKIIMDNQDYEIQGRYYSENITAITDLISKNSLIIGFVTFKDQLTRIVMDHNGKQDLELLTAFGCLDGIELKGADTFQSETLFIGFKTNKLGYYGLIEYAKIVYQLKTLTPLEGKILTGWCSWYYYFHDVSEKDLEENLDYFRGNRDDFPIDLFQLDDGYQENVGDYLLLNEKFNRGLVPIFSRSKDMGFRGGIWTAPFFATKKSQLYKDHPDWFLRNTKGKLIKVDFNWGNWEYSLDVSNEEVLNYIRELFENLKFGRFSKDTADLKEPIITFFKIDFIYCVIPLNADFADKTKTRAQIYYSAVKTIREAIGKDSYLLGCGAPIGPSVGLVDSMRIGTDTAPSWNFLNILYNKFNIGVPSMRTAIYSTIYRSFMHKYFWVNDPDCLMVRDTDTKLTLDEIQTQLTIFGLSGGQVLISDNMSKISESSKANAKLLLPPYNPKGFDPVPTDILYVKDPTIYMLETDEVVGKRYLVACCINWGNKQLEGKVKISDIIPNLSESENKFYVFDFWNQNYLGEFTRDDDIYVGIVGSHSCKYLSILSIDTRKYDESKPILLSSTIHISQGCREISDFEYMSEEKVLKITFNLPGRREGKIFLILPDNLNIKKCESCLSFQKLEWSSKNIWEVSLEFNDELKLIIHLR